jgi:hypothetical protein
MLIDAATGEPAQAVTMESDPLRRDVELVVGYDDWSATAAGIPFPGSVTITYDGIMVQDEKRTVSTDVALDETRFAIPDGLEPVADPALAMRGDVNHWYLQSFAALGFPADGLMTNAAVELAPGVHHVTGGSHHSLAVIRGPRDHHGRGRPRRR